MVSYKNLYEKTLTELKELKELYNQPDKETESDYICPLCGNTLLESTNEIYCSDENCKYDLTIVDLIAKLNLQRKD